MTIKPIQNVNNGMLTHPSAPQNNMSAVDAKAVAAPTPVIPGAPMQQQKSDSVEISTKEKKKSDPTLFLAFLIGVTISSLSLLFSKKIRR